MTVQYNAIPKLGQRAPRWPNEHVCGFAAYARFNRAWSWTARRLQGDLDRFCRRSCLSRPPVCADGDGDAGVCGWWGDWTYHGVTHIEPCVLVEEGSEAPGC